MTSIIIPEFAYPFLFIFNPCIVMRVFPFIFLIGALFTGGQTGVFAQSYGPIETILTAYVQAGDRQDPEALDLLLDDEYRVVLNRLFGSEEVTILEKQAYLDKIRSKEFGGDKRTMEIEQLSVYGTSATARVRLRGAQFSSLSFLHVIQDTDGDWRLISDMPVIIP